MIKFDNIKNIVGKLKSEREEMKRKKQKGWNSSDEVLLSEEVFFLYRDITAHLKKYTKDNRDEQNFNDYTFLQVWGTYDHIDIGIDNILNFDIEDEFHFNNYDIYFFFLTFFLLFLNGYFWFSLLYVSLGWNMVYQCIWDQEEEWDHSELMGIADLTYRTFYLLKTYNDGNIRLKDNNLKKNTEWDGLERIKFMYNCMYRYNYYNELILRKISPDFDFFNKNTFIKYNIFFFKYENILNSYIISKNLPEINYITYNNTIYLNNYNYKYINKNIKFFTIVKNRFNYKKCYIII